MYFSRVMDSSGAWPLYVLYKHGEFATPLAILEPSDISRLFEAMGKEAVEKTIAQLWQEDDGAGQR